MDTMAAWRTATTQRVLIQSERQPGTVRGPATRAPAGTYHAYLPGRRETPCGQHLLELELWPAEAFSPPADAPTCAACRDATFTAPVGTPDAGRRGLRSSPR